MKSLKILSLAAAAAGSLFVASCCCSGTSSGPKMPSAPNFAPIEVETTSAAPAAPAPVVKPAK